MPTIVRRTAANMNRQLHQGMPVTPQTSLQSLARQTQALLSSPQQSIQALQRSQGGIQHHRNFVVKNRLEDELELEIALQEIEHMAGSRKSNPKPKTWPTPPPKINVGEIKPDTPSGRSAGHTELNSRGNMTDIEPGARKKVETATGQSFKDKHGNAGGADLIPK
ncbi:hypothetical protein [Limnofasciculus baicalensis]|uniref:Uncharacterized protein n=1 Tax=Limnofasciculus baicalensis BBK-W-15 TaxID=2699891 RepID=A0AAE3GQN0_9CYAN|nr:hypothetical protein [Limnofasciculus baicalensis]MCP2728078.1 hypothetical protein [Limnofasciculus baicalensis BBK-W-15]